MSAQGAACCPLPTQPAQAEHAKMTIRLPPPMAFMLFNQGLQDARCFAHPPERNKQWQKHQERSHLAFSRAA